MAPWEPGQQSRVVRPPPEGSHRFPKVLEGLGCGAVHLPCVLAQIKYQELEPASLDGKLNILTGTF